MDEFFTIVAREKREDPTSEIVPCGCVTRRLAHSQARIPHASVQVIPVRSGTGNIVLHQRSAAVINSPERWDVPGGHVTFEMGILMSAGGLEDASVETALREAREEMLLATGGKPHLIQRGHLRQIGYVGQFEWGVDDPDTRNVEYSTAFVLCIPEGAAIAVPFEFRNGTIQESLPIRELGWEHLLELYQGSRLQPPAEPFAQSEFRQGFADGLARILDQALSSPQVRDDLEMALRRCRDQKI